MEEIKLDSPSVEKDSGQFIPYPESVGRSPKMYVGSLTNLICSLIKESIKICETDLLFFRVTIEKGHRIIFEIKSDVNTDLIVEEFNKGALTGDLLQYHFQILKYLCTRVEVTTTKQSMVFLNDGSMQDSSTPQTTISEGLRMTIEPVALLLSDPIDKNNVIDKLLTISILNRNAEILLKDKREKYLNQNYFHFPQGIKYLFERTCRDVLGGVFINILFDKQIHENKYQVALGYTRMWNNDSHSVCFANDKQIEGGVMLDGIISSLLLACKEYISQNNLLNYVASKKKLFRGLIIICAVRAEKVELSINERILNPEIKRDIQKALLPVIFEYFENNKSAAERLMDRFDRRDIVSKMISQMS